jgi:hypothetical protein
VATARSLADQQRIQQLQLRAALLRQLLEAYQVLNQRRLDQTFPQWFRLVANLIVVYRGYSASVAGRYVREVRNLTVDGPPPAVPVRPLPVAQVQKALQVTSVRTVKQAAARRVTPREAANLGFVNSSGAATRLALNAGREMVIDTVQADRLALGWMRITDGDPCAFCAMLASAGARYKSEETASFQAHAHCGCTAAPIYDRSDPVPDLNRQFAKLWRKSTRGLKGQDAFNAFRRAHEASQVQSKVAPS